MFEFLDKSVPITSQQWSEDTVPLVSISCITYNHENFIRDAIEGFLMQKTTFPVEILIHDDASTDKTASIVREYEEKYPHLIKPIYQTENQYSKRDGSIGRIQRERARGKYYATCEGDDYWTDPLKLQKQVDTLEANPTCSFCCHSFAILDNEQKIFKSTIKRRRLFKTGNFYFSITNMFGWGAQPLTMVINMNSHIKATNEIEKYNYKFIRDVHIYYYLLKQGKGFFINEIMGVYRHHNTGIHSKIQKIRQKEIRYTIYYELFKESPDPYTITMYFASCMSLFLYHFKWKKYKKAYKYFLECINCFIQNNNWIHILRYYPVYVTFFIVNHRSVRKHSVNHVLHA